MNSIRPPLFFFRLAHILVIIILLSGCIQIVPYTATRTQISFPQGEITATEVPATIEPKSATSEVDNTKTTKNNLTQFGLLTVLPGSSSATFTPQVITAIKATGVRYMRVAFEWAVSEPQSGQISFTSRNDQMIQEIENAGLRVFPTLYVGSGWMNGNPSGRQAGGSRSYPPNDLSNQWNEQYGYSSSYYNFVYTFVSHYRGHFEYITIENEANSILFWGGTADDYVRLLKTAYKAIKAADQQVIVASSGFVSSALGLCMADDYLKQGLKTTDEVLQFISDYYMNISNKPSINTKEQLDQTLSQSKIHDQCQRIGYMLDNMANSVDAVNFHFYENYSVLSAVVEWLRLRTSAAGYTPEIVSNEMGVRNQGSNFAGSTGHAQEVVKDMITSMSLDLRAVVWFSADTIKAGKDKVGLFDSADQMRPAGSSMKLVIDTMAKVSSFSQAISSGSGIYHYIFIDSGGVPSIEVLWVEGNEISLELQGPPGAMKAVITDYAGNIKTLPVADGSVKLSVGNAPLFVLWK